MTERHLRKYCRVHAPFHRGHLWNWWRLDINFHIDPSDIELELFVRLEPQSSATFHKNYRTGRRAFMDLIHVLRHA